MLRVRPVELISLNFCSSKKLGTPLAFAESQLGAQEGSPPVSHYLLTAQDRPEVLQGLLCRSSLQNSGRVPAPTVIGDW
jgi:hypothetical protein